MKFFSGLILIQTLFILTANATSSTTITLGQSDNELTLQSSIYRTEYKQEIRNYQCNPQQICTSEIGNVCEDYPEQISCDIENGRRICRKVEGGSSCHDETFEQCQTIYSTCSELVNVPYEVYDHELVSHIKVINQSMIDLTNAKLNISQPGSHIAVSLSGAPQALVYSEVKIISSAQQSRNVEVILTAKSNDEILKSIGVGIRNSRIENHTLIFETGDIAGLKNTSIHLIVKKYRFILKDPTLINRDLLAQEVSVRSIGNGLFEARIELDRLIGHFNRNRKHTFTLDLRSNVDINGVINKSDLPSMNFSKTMIVND